MKPTNHSFDDTQLEAMLKKYGEAEPRVGMEGRVLARLAEEREHSPAYAWWWRLVVAVLAIGAVAGIAVFVAIKPGSRHEIVNRIPYVNTGQIPTPILAALAAKQNAARTTILHQAQRKAQFSVEPRLEQFPAPAPLNEQEVMLMRYVRDRRPEAVIVAKAREEIRKQDLARFEAALPLDQRSQDSE